MLFRSGLVIAAKSYAALRDMNEIIRTDLLKKEYYTITVGIPQSGRFTAWWEHDEKNNKVSIHAHQSQDCLLYTSRVPGVGPASARMLHLLPEVSRYYEHSRTSTEGALTTTERLAAYLKPRFAGAKQEKALLLSLDSRSRVKSVYWLKEEMCIRDSSWWVQAHLSRGRSVS